jgi:hypothetical protein
MTHASNDFFDCGTVAHDTTTTTPASFKRSKRLEIRRSKTEKINSSYFNGTKPEKFIAAIKIKPALFVL